MTAGEYPDRTAEIRYLLRSSQPALDAVEATTALEEPTLSRDDYRAISSALQRPSTFSGKTYGLLVEKALINQIPEEQIAPQVRVQYGGHSPVRFTDTPELPDNRYVSPAIKSGVNGLVVGSLHAYVADVEAYIETSSGAPAEELPFDLLNRRVKEAAGQKVSVTTLEHWRLVSEIILETEKYLHD